MIALEAATGSIVWRTRLPQELVYRLVPGENDDVIATTFGAQILSLSTFDGSIRWRHTDQVASFSPTLAAGRLFFIGLDQQLHARDAFSGRVLWRNASRFAGSTVYADKDRVFALDVAGEPVVLDARSGNESAIFADPGRAAAAQPSTATMLKLQRRAIGTAATNNK